MNTYARSLRLLSWLTVASILAVVVVDHVTVESGFRALGPTLLDPPDALKAAGMVALIAAVLLGLVAICAVISNRYAPAIDASNVLTGGDES